MSAKAALKAVESTPARAAQFSSLTTANHTNFTYEGLDEAFPKADPNLVPTGHVILVQIRQPKRKTRGGIELPPEARSTEHYNTQIAKIIAMGSLCFKSPHHVTDEAGNVTGETLVDWAGGPWHKPGDFVRVPRYGGDRFTAAIKTVTEVYDPDEKRMVPETVDDEVIFMLIKAKDILGSVVNPLAGKAYLD